MELTEVLYGRERGVVTITLNRPEADNTMTTRTYLEVREALRAAEADEEAGVLVLTGAGSKAFSVGGDFQAHKARTPANFRRHLGVLMDVAVLIRNCGKPVIAAVNGLCFGGAHQMVLLCDLTIAAENARFGQHGVRRGTAPIFWGTQLLPRIVGEKRAREIAFLCFEYDAQEALRMGLVNKVVPQEELMAETRRWCDRLLQMSPTGLRIAKTSLNYGSDQHYAGVWHAREMLAMVAGTAEFAEAVDSDREGRPPRRRAGG